jgi:hypothetical protein
VHLAVLEDAVRLVLHAEAFDAVIKQSLVNHYDSALCASGTRGNHTCSPFRFSTTCANVGPPAAT